MSWLEDWLISEIFEISRTLEVLANTTTECAPPTQTTEATFQLNSTRLYMPVLTLSTNDDIRCLENIKQGLKGKISWNRYRPEITTTKKQQFRLYD